MTAAAVLLPLFLVDSLSILSPGPGILLVTQAAAERSRRDALAATLGLAVGGFAWACLAVTGLTVLFEVLPTLQTTIRLGGALFLLYLAVRLWRSRGGPATIAGAHETRAPSLGRAFLQGLGTSALNPKALAYFASIFVVLVPADAPAWVRGAGVSLVFADTLLWYGLAALLFSTPRVVRGYLALRRPIDRACAVLMAAFGVKLMV